MKIANRFLSTYSLMALRTWVTSAFGGGEGGRGGVCCLGVFWMNHSLAYRPLVL